MSFQARKREKRKPWRAAVLARDGGRCFHCGTVGRWEAHHAVAIADGGKDTLDNLLTLCPACHAAVTRARSGYRATLVVTRAIPEQFTLDFRDPATRIPYCEFAVGS